MIKKVFLGVFALIVVFLAVQIVLVLRTYAALDDVSADYAYGPEDADLSVVEFIKYTCPHCRDVHPVILEAVERDGNVRYVPRPLPSEVEDAHMAYAAGEQGMFKLAHGLLLQDPRILDEGGLMAIAETAGFDLETLQADMKSEAVEERVYENIKLFLGIGGTHTPTFVIGGKIIYVPEGRMPTVEDFLAMFEEARG